MRDASICNVRHCFFLRHVSTLCGLLVASSALASSALDANDRDPSVSPRQDFYAHASGGWLARTGIPPDRGRWGSFDALQDRVTGQLLEVVEAAVAAQPAAGTAAQKVADFYTGAMDVHGIDADGVKPLEPALAQVAAIDDAASLATVLAQLHKSGTTALFAPGVATDPNDSDRLMVHLVQAGRPLGPPAYYLEEMHADKRAAYTEHIARLFALLGHPVAEARRDAEAVLQLETRLAEAALTPVQLRDPQRTHNRRALAALPTGFDWPTYFAALGCPEPGVLNVQHPPYLQRVTDVLGGDFGALRAYLLWQVTHRSAPYLSTPFVDEDFAFFGRTLGGTPTLQPRHKRVIAALDRYLGDDLGQLYVARHFAPEARQQAQALVQRLRDALQERIAQLPWMSDATRQEAARKLHRMRVKIGYPDTWVDTRSLVISRCYLANVWRASAFALQRELARVGLPPDREGWQMTPQTVNAYFDPTLNEIVFPAAILQPPFFSAEADEAENFGAFGAVVGHELTHAFDDEGRQYDADGNLRDWWTPDDAHAFALRAQAIVAQFDGYTLFDRPVNGALTQGENIADLGGLKIAFAAMQRAAPAARLESDSREQRFFFAWARVWRNHVRPDVGRQLLETDPHAPGQWRVNGPLCNMPEFHAAFAVQPGDAMFCDIDRRVDIW